MNPKRSGSSVLQVVGIGTVAAAILGFAGVQQHGAARPSAEAPAAWIEVAARQPERVTRCLGQTYADPSSATFEFELHARSDALAGIRLTEQSCGCLATSLDGEPLTVDQLVRWGEASSRLLAVQLSRSEQPRDMAFHITLAAVSRDGTEQPLTVRGRLKTVPDLRVSPPVVRLDADGADAEAAEVTVEQFVPPGQPIGPPPEIDGLPEGIAARRLASVAADASEVGGEAGMSANDPWVCRRWRFELARQGVQEPPHGEPLTVRARVRGSAGAADSAPTATLVVQWGSRGVSAPRDVLLQDSDDSLAGSRRLPLISRDGQAFRIERVQSGEGQRATVRFDHDRHSTLQWLVIESDIAGPWKEEVVVYTDHPRTPILKIEVRRTGGTASDAA